MTEPVCPDITLILPAFNEAATIARTVTEAVEYFRSRVLRYELIDAADGDDGTREICREMSRTDAAIWVMGRKERGGKGRGIREAVGAATGEIVGFADADNKVPVTEFDKVRASLQEFPIVIGSRAVES